MPNNNASINEIEIIAEGNESGSSSSRTLIAGSLTNFVSDFAESDSTPTEETSLLRPNNEIDTLIQTHRNFKTNWPGAVFLTVNAALGAGLLNYPHAFDEAGGLFYPSIVQVVCLCISRFTIKSLMVLITHLPTF